MATERLAAGTAVATSSEFSLVAGTKVAFFLKPGTGTTPTTADDDLLGRWIDQSDFANDIQAASDGARGVRSTRSGVVMCEQTANTTRYLAPVVCRDTICTFFYVSALRGPQCFEWYPLAADPAATPIPNVQAAKGIPHADVEFQTEEGRPFITLTNELQALNVRMQNVILMDPSP